MTDSGATRPATAPEGMTVTVSNLPLSDASKPVAQSGYLRGEGEAVGPLFAMPSPALRDRAEDVRSAWWTTAARANDAVLNNGWIAGVVDQVVALMIGSELRLNYKPDGTLFGWDARQTRSFARNVKRRWRVWGSQPRECDANGRYTMGQLQAAAVRQWFATGESLGELDWIPRAGCQTSTKVRLIPSHWLSQRTDPYNNLFHGVRLGAHDPEPVGYLFENRAWAGSLQATEKPARDGFGRPRIIHVFDGVGGQTRGITPLAPALKVVRQFDQLSDATLTAAMIHAIFAATIESDYPTGEVMAALQDQDELAAKGLEAGDPAALAGTFEEFLGQKVGWNKGVNIDLGRHGKIAHLMLGEKLKLHGSEHPNSTFEAFANFLLREVASCLGVMFEDLTGDYRGATYSSIRMAVAKKWPLLEYRRRHIAGRFTQPIFEAWLEEEIEAGRIVIPGGIDTFVANRTAMLRCDWRGPAKPQADEVKAAKALVELYKLGAITLEQVCNDLGTDYEDILDQLEAERDARNDRGLPDPLIALLGHNGGPPLDDEPDAKNEGAD